MLKDNDISVQEYDKISKYKNLDIETEKILHLNSGTMTVVALGTIKKETLTRYLAVPAYKENKKLLFAELLISSRKYYQHEWKNITQHMQQKKKKKNRIHIITTFFHPG